MQTQLMQPWDSGVPWLERFVHDSDAPERTPLQSLPFTIGRIETADLQVNSTRVSREHAVIVRETGGYRIRDLGSTNGTFVNGQRIEEVALSDGDVVVIADCEFTFVSAAPETKGRHMATQVLGDNPRPQSSPVAGAPERILAIRRLQEALLHRSFLPRLAPILNLERNATFGFRSEGVSASWKDTELDSLAGASSGTNRMLWRAQQAYRLLTVEAFLNLDQDALLFVDVKPDELDHGRATEAHLARIGHLAGESRLVVGLAANTVADDRRARDLCDRVKRLGLQLAYFDFLGGRAQVMQFTDAPPDFLLLAANLASELQAGSRQSRQLAAVREACAELDIQPIVTGLRRREDEEDCLKLGFRLASSERIARPASTSSSGKLWKAGDARVEAFA